VFAMNYPFPFILYCSECHSEIFQLRSNGMEKLEDELNVTQIK